MLLLLLLPANQIDWFQFSMQDKAIPGHWFNQPSLACPSRLPSDFIPCTAIAMTVARIIFVVYVFNFNLHRFSWFLSSRLKTFHQSLHPAACTILLLIPRIWQSASRFPASFIRNRQIYVRLRSIEGKKRWSVDRIVYDSDAKRSCCLLCSELQICRQRALYDRRNDDQSISLIRNPQCDEQATQLWHRLQWHWPWLWISSSSTVRALTIDISISISMTFIRSLCHDSGLLLTFFARCNTCDWVYVWRRLFHHSAQSHVD